VTDHTFFGSTDAFSRSSLTCTCRIHRLLVIPLRGMQMRSSDENSVCLSVRPSTVRPSVKRVLCDKMVERSVQIFISFSLVFREEEWLVHYALSNEPKMIIVRCP